MDADLPSLWPLPSPSFNVFARDGNLDFSWDSHGFRISQSGLIRTRSLARFPLTAEGWVQAWSHPYL